MKSTKLPELNGETPHNNESQPPHKIPNGTDDFNSVDRDKKDAEALNKGQRPHRSELDMSYPEEPFSFWKLFLDNWLYVTTYCTVFGSFGVCVGFLGPTVFDLGCQTHAGLKSMNWVFFVQLIMTLVGSISAGWLADKVPIHSLMLVGAVGVAMSMFFIPACGNLTTLIAILVLMGWCMGCLDCLANLKVIQMFGNNVGPFLQAMHCSYGIGAFVSPMIASAFLLNKDCTPYIDGYTIQTPTYRAGQGQNGSHNEASTVTVHIPPQPEQVFRYRHMSKLPNAFYILGGLQLTIAALVAYVILQEIRGNLKPGNGNSNSNLVSPRKSFSLDRLSGWVKDTCCACGPRDVIIVTLITCLALFVFDGLQSSFANYIYTYAHESGVQGLEKYEGAVLDACFWGLFATGRLLAVPIASKMTAAFMLMINIGGCAIALLITFIFRWSHVVMYIGACSVGLFVSSMSPTVMSLAETFVDINPSITTCLVVVAALGEALCPVIVGNLVVHIGPTSFLVFCLTFSLSAILLYILLMFAGRRTEKYAASPMVSFVWIYPAGTRRQKGESTLIKPTNIKYYSRMAESDSIMEMGSVAVQTPTRNGVDG